MGQRYSRLLGSNELGLVRCKEYRTKYSGLVVLKLQPGGDLLLAGNELGSLLIYDISLDSESPHQVITLSFEYGGISEICWLDSTTVAIGTTRGRIVVFVVKNNSNIKRLMEVSSAKAHGDGAAQIAVEALDYCPKTCRLVSAAEGVGSVRLWNVSDAGVITPRATPKLTTAYCTPRYVSFFRDGSQLIVAFMEQSLVQVFSTDPLEVKIEFRLGQEHGSTHQDHLGNALVLNSSDRMVVYNLRDGCAFYNLPNSAQTMGAPYAMSHGRGYPYCNQGLALMGNATYVASASRRGVIHILRTTDGGPAGSVRISGRRQDIQAIHAASSSHTVLVAASTDAANGASHLTVWRDKESIQLRNAPSVDRNERSTIGIVLLCIGICITFQLVVSLLPAGDLTAFFRNPSSPVEQHHEEGATLITMATPTRPATESYVSTPLHREFTKAHSIGGLLMMNTDEHDIYPLVASPAKPLDK